MADWWSGGEGRGEGRGEQEGNGGAHVVTGARVGHRVVCSEGKRYRMR